MFKLDVAERGSSRAQEKEVRVACTKFGKGNKRQCGAPAEEASDGTGRAAMERKRRQRWDGNR